MQACDHNVHIFMPFPLVVASLSLTYFIFRAIDRDPIPGWVDTLSAATGVYAACGFGLLKFLPGHATNATDQVLPRFMEV